MDKFFRMFSKSASKKDIENKAKEEEDVILESNWNFVVSPLKQNDILNKLVKDLKIGGVPVENYDNFNIKIDKLFSQYKDDKTELEYRFSKYCEKNEVLSGEETSDIDKMKLIGKIGTCPTVLEETSMNGELLFTNNKNKIESKNGFGSIRTNNCVFKRKWFYEAQILTNGLQQIGWCQLNTPFTPTDGVGDDLTSYAYDGYRLVLWHNGKINYGTIWDLGDILGCCIDLDNRTIEYFKNGVPLGIAAKDLKIGENIAYFPGISLSQDEKVIFNFGKSPFEYSYPGYEPFDLPGSIFNGACEVTAELLDLLKNSLVKLISSNDIMLYHKMCLTNKIFSFLAQVSFKDLFTFKTLIFPFLFELNSYRPEEFLIFFDHLFMYLQNHTEKLEFVNFFFDNLTGMIEQNALKGFEGIEDWRSLMSIFLKLMKIDYIVELWIENGKTIDQLKCLFNSNLLKMEDICKFLIEKYPNSDISVYKAFKESKDEFKDKFLTRNNEIENIYSETLKPIISLFLQDERQFKIKSNEINLKQILVDFVNKGYDFGSSFSVIFEQIVHQTTKKDNTSFFKNFVFNLYSMFSEYFTWDLDKFGIDVWFNRLQNGNLFYDEIGIGGSISHVTAEYISTIEEKFRCKNKSFYSELNHRIIKISIVLQSHLREMTKMLDKYKNTPLKNMMNFENGTSHFSKLFRAYFYLYTDKNEIMLYKYAFFLIKWINLMIKQNKNILYFIPNSVYEIPFDILQFLYKVKSRIILDTNYRFKVNKSSIHYIYDDFTYEVVYFYTLLFGDQNIANPELKESLINKIKFFLKKPKISKIYEEDTEAVENLIKGQLHYMSIESLCHIACEIMVKIIKPICFGYSNNNNEKVNFVKITKKFFENNIKAFHEFMDNYSKLINKVMTEYTIILNECASKILSTSNSQVDPYLVETKSTLLRKFVFAYNLLCDLMKIFEFLLAAYPNEFFDISSLNYSRFVNFLKNTSSRILEKPYIVQLTALLEKTKPSNNLPGGKESILYMAYSIIGIIQNIDVNKDYPKYQEFLKKIANLSDLDMEPFLALFKIVCEINPNRDFSKYESIIDYFLSHREKKRERIMSTEEWEETNKNEHLCIICYANNSDRILIPCKHVCCNECLLQYLSDKKHCFICNADIESTELLKR